jgi:hypothetical protein
MKEWSFGRMVIGKGNSKYLEDNLLQSHFIHDKSHINDTRAEQRARVRYRQLTTRAVTCLYTLEIKYCMIY